MKTALPLVYSLAAAKCPICPLCYYGCAPWSYPLRSITKRNKQDYRICGKDFTLQWRHNGHDGISSLTIVYSSVYSGADQRKHQNSASLAIVRGIHRWPMNSPHKWPVTRKSFHLMTSSWFQNETNKTTEFAEKTLMKHEQPAYTTKQMDFRI